MTFKDFIAGKKGWSHAAVEFGVWAVLIGFCGWLISPVAAILAMIILFYGFQFYWFKREINQSLAMGREPSYDDLKSVPDFPTRFWTADAIEDVKTPKKMRWVWVILSLIYIGWLFQSMGVKGLWL